ncbi:PLxRFG domain-containing protein, partial [Desulfovibrio sp. ZJ369]|uniref:PLxRFG domain-containing protein n=1 Tax=Desulfovibrio sp. ZJ369 TaxID=2709793 RepID=UPI0013EC6E86
MIRNLPALLAEPVMVFRSGTQADSLVALLEGIHEGMPVVAAVHLDVSRGSVNINEIASVHGRSGGLGWVAGEIQAGRRVYADKTKIPTWLRGFSGDQGSRRMSGLQLPGAFVLPNDPRGIKILTEKDVVKPVAPPSAHEDDAPLASLSPGAILGMTIRRAARAARAADEPEIRHMFRENDISLLQSIVQLPHWIAKQIPAFATVYDRQLKRMDERSAALKESLETVPSMFGKDRLKSADMDSLREILWATEGSNPKELEDVTKFISKGSLPNGRKTIEVNPAFYKAYEAWVDTLPGTKAAKRALVEIRKSLDQDLVLAHNRMASMSEMSDDAIKTFRQSIGHVPNYFPHHRYGAYFVQAKVGNEVVFRQHFDAFGEKAAMAKARKIVAEQRENYPDAEWTDGKNDRLPDEVLGAPIDSEAMEQIIRAATAKIDDRKRAGEIADLLTESVADVLKTRGWGAHGIQRKGIPGFETEDIAKVLYDYKAGLNGWLTKMEAARDFSAALSQIDARQTPNLWKYTAQYVKDMLRNSDRVDRLTGNIKAVAFAWYLGGSIKTAFVNATQNLAVGVPRLQMDVMGGGREWLAGARSALVDRVTGNKGKGLTEDEARLVRELYGESVITDAFMEEVRGQLRGVSGASLWNKLTRVLGLPMSEAERFNRASLALAAFRAARSGKLKARAREKYGVKGKADYEQAKAFAADVVRDAHFVYGKGNMPEFMRSNIAGRAMSSMYTFRMFTHNMVAMWSWALRTQGREGAAFVAKSLGATMALGGVTALPLYATLMALCQIATGDDDDWTELIRKHLPESNLLRDVVCYGAPAMAGVNIGGSLKMETPLTRGLTKGKTPQEVLTNSIGDIIGIPYDLLVVKPSRMMEAYRGGSVYRAVEEASPVIMKNAMQAWRLYSEGQTTMRGRPINSPGQTGARKLTGTEAVGKALGFQPVSSTKSYDAYAASKHADQVRSDKIDELTVLTLRTYDTGDPAGRREAIREIARWNEKMKDEGKPHMLISFKDVMRRVKAR